MIPELKFSPDAATLVVVVLAFCFHVWRTIWKPRHTSISPADSSMVVENSPPLVRGIPLRPTVDPDDMDVEMWRGVCKRSGILRGWTASLIEGPHDKTQWAMKRARKPAFELAEDAGDFFDVHDNDTFISVRQVTQGLETALAYKAFSENGAKLAINLGFHGVTAGLGADIAKKKESSSSVESEKTFSKAHISYNIPRVSVEIRDSPDFRLTSELTQHLRRLGRGDELGEKITEDQLNDYTAFIHDYGDLFCTKLLLGGRLHCLQNVSKDAQTNMRVHKDELKFAMTANVMSPAGGFDGAGYHGRGSEVSSFFRSTNIRGGISIEAQGGNPLVCWSPPDWVLSVGSYYNWRVIDQDMPCNLVNLIAARLDKAGEKDHVALAGARRLQKLQQEFNRRLKNQGTEEQAAEESQQGQREQEAQQTQEGQEPHQEQEAHQDQEGQQEQQEQQEHREQKRPREHRRHREHSEHHDQERQQEQSTEEERQEQHLEEPRQQQRPRKPRRPREQRGHRRREGYQEQEGQQEQRPPREGERME